MDEKVYIHTDIVLDLLDINRPNYYDSAYVVNKISSNPECTAFINCKTINNIYNILQEFGKFSEEAIYREIEYICDIFTVVPYGAKEIRIARDTFSNKIFKNYDAAIHYACAATHECSIIITGEEKKFLKSIIFAKTPKMLASLW